MKIKWAFRHHFECFSYFVFIFILSRNKVMTFVFEFTFIDIIRECFSKPKKKHFGYSACNPRTTAKKYANLSLAIFSIRSFRCDGVTFDLCSLYGFWKHQGHPTWLDWNWFFVFYSTISLVVVAVVVPVRRWYGIYLHNINMIGDPSENWS